MKHDPLLLAILGLVTLSIPVDAWANWHYGIAAVLQWAIIQLIVVLVVLRALSRPSRLPGCTPIEEAPCPCCRTPSRP